MSKQWERIAADAVKDTLYWKHRARVADDTARRLLLALADLLDEADLGEVSENTQPVVDRARAAIAAAKGEA
jgi:hypothetical protein